MPTLASVLRASPGLPIVLVLFATACSTGDVGAPCNHGDVDPPSTKVVTFPALSCDELLCVYGEERVVPPGDCDEDADCNAVGAEAIFACELPAGGGKGSCVLSLDHVLERSMCSKRCSSDADCNNAGAGHQPVAQDTACRSGFSCARIQALGEFCCERLCVCNDELPDTSELDANCQAGLQPGCEDYGRI